MRPELSPSQVVTVFRSRLRPDANPAYGELAAAMEAIARQAPGFVDFKAFTAPDGERVSLITFTTAEAQRAWRDDPRHRQAQRRGREEFYLEYSIQVTDCVDVRQWEADPPASD
ncbi:MAG TPA: antibiotic biosynthesis monooxygenase [Acidimicrobiales bacterium]|jgi:heme-degrading monooxygenase HmoA|nr:antibiotic biosynthesis monooxygenase [Acidimicrobiales bacterium]